MYSPQVLDHFEHPRKAGEIAGPDAFIQMENPVCGDVLRLTLKLSAGRIGEIRFLAKGCVPSMACASALTELVWEKPSRKPGTCAGGSSAGRTGGLPPAPSHAGHLRSTPCREASTNWSISPEPV